jgi:hypothetical protein
MTRRLPAPWHADKFSGGYVVRDADGFAVAYVYGRSTEAEAMEAKQMTMDEARRVASNIALRAVGGPLSGTFRKSFARSQLHRF